MRSASTGGGLMAEHVRAARAVQLKVKITRWRGSTGHPGQECKIAVTRLSHRAAGLELELENPLHVQCGEVIRATGVEPMEPAEREQLLEQLRQALIVAMRLARRLDMIEPTDIYDRPVPISIIRAAQIAGCNHHTLRRAVHRGELRAHRAGTRLLVYRHDLDAYLDRETRMEEVRAVAPPPALTASIPVAAPAAEVSKASKAKAKKPAAKKQGATKVKAVRGSRPAKSRNASTPVASSATDDAAAMIADAVLVGQPAQCDLPWTE